MNTTFDDDSARRIAAAVRAMEATPGNPTPPRRGGRMARFPPLQVVHVLNATPALGLYDAKVSIYDDAAQVWNDQDAVWALEPNGAAVAVGYYLGRLAGGVSNRPVYAVFLSETGLGPQLAVVTGVCPTLGAISGCSVISGSSVVTDLTTETTLITLPVGTSIGALSCATNYNLCCAVQTNCCGNKIPANLHVTLINTSGCACLDGLVIPVGPYTVASNAWAGSIASPGCNFGAFHPFVTATLNCIGGDQTGWQLVISCTDGNTGQVSGKTSDVTSTCSPLNLVFDGFSFTDTGTNKCCVGTFKAVVTT